MKLGALGAVTVVIGVVLSSVGLVAIGAYWVVMGGIAHLLKPRLTTKTPEGATPDKGNFLLGVGVLLAVGIPSLVVGILALGIDDGDAAWRWLPIGVGALATFFGGGSGLLYLLGSGITAAGDLGGGPPTVPATIWIRSMQETGTFVNERPRIEFVLHVEPDTETEVAAYDVTKKATVPFTALGSLRVGEGFRATVVGPEHPETMDIAWDQPVSGAA